MLVQENNQISKFYMSGPALINCIINTQSAGTFVGSLDLKLKTIQECKHQKVTLCTSILFKKCQALYR